MPEKGFHVYATFMPVVWRQFPCKTYAKVWRCKNDTSMSENWHYTLLYSFSPL